MNIEVGPTVDPAPPTGGDPAPPVAPPVGGKGRVTHKKHKERQARARAKRSGQAFWHDIFVGGGLGMVEFKDRHPEPLGI